MRVSQILSSPVYNHKVQSKKAPKQNVSFGLIEEENREKIIANIPEKDEELKQWRIADIDKNKGTIVRWGGKDCSRGLIYADLIPEYVEKSPANYLYNDKFFKKSMSHIEKYDNFTWFSGTVSDINLEESRAKKGIKKVDSSSSSDSDYNAAVGDNSMEAYNLYGCH